MTNNTQQEEQNVKRLAGSIRLLRETNQMTIREFAEKVGVGHSDIFRIENGNTKNPGVFMIHRIAAAFDLTVDELMNFDAMICPTCDGSGWVRSKKP